MSRHSHHVGIAVTFLIGLAGCSGSSSGSNGSPDGGDSGACVLADGQEVSAEAVGDLNCTLDGETVLMLGYTDCEDGSDLYVTGEREGSENGGYVVIDGESGTWTAGPWDEAWSSCYGL